MHIDHDNLALSTESDVEQKIIMPLLTGTMYLDIPADKIFTKQYMAPTPLDKAAGREGGYYPDYAIWMRGFPVLIVEAKAPDVPAEVGYREASLYARHLNQSYRTNLNPCRFLVATNGKTLLFGYWDSQPEIVVAVDNLRLGSKDLEHLQQCCHKRLLEAHAVDCVQRVRARNSICPYNLAGGQALLHAKLPVNSFAADLSPILRLYFSSSYQEYSREIMTRGYVSSAEVTEYDRVLEALLKDHLTTRRGTIVRELQPGRHDEVNVEHAILEFDELRPEAGQLQIVQGAVGSGKSLFIRRYKEALQSAELRERTRWAFIDFNSSPPSFPKGKSG
ncbi:MAG: type I restriction endonuclease [Terriglobia bacterium]